MSSFAEAVLGRAWSRVIDSFFLGSDVSRERELVDNVLTSEGWRIALGHGDILLRKKGKIPEGSRGYINNPAVAHEERMWDVDRNYYGTGMNSRLRCRMVGAVAYPEGITKLLVSYDGTLVDFEQFYTEKTKGQENAEPAGELSPLQKVAFAVEHADLIGLEIDRKTGQITTWHT